MPTGTMLDVSADQVLLQTRHRARHFWLPFGGCDDRGEYDQGSLHRPQTPGHHRFSVEEAQAAFEMAQQPTALKVMMENKDF